MCGRYVSSTPPAELAEHFNALAAPGIVDKSSAKFNPNFNAAPTQSVFAIYEPATKNSGKDAKDSELAGKRLLDKFHWGLIPFWAKDPKIGNRMINARAETITEKNSYRVPRSRRRCIITADGFYEWFKPADAKNKTPMYITRTDGELFAFAGLWETWRPDPDQPTIQSCTIITCEANDKMAEIHHRMPVILPSTLWDAWLDTENTDSAAAADMLIPAPSGLIQFHPVSTDVNNIRNNFAELITQAD